MRTLLVQEFIDELNKASEEKKFSFDIYAQKAFDQSNEEFPRVIVRQMTNRPKHVVTDDEPLRMEATTTIGYQIEIYSRAKKSHDGIVFDKVDVGDILAKELIDWFWCEKGLQRNSWSPSSSHDNQTIRSTFRVNGVLDRYDKIYRN